MGVPHPIPYQGSKRNLAASIIAYLPQETGRLIEPFAGSAAISLAASCSRRADRFLINDANVPLIALWDRIINAPQQISEEYRHLWEEQQGQEQHYYYVVRDKFNKSQEPHYLLYLLARCVKASVRYNSLGEFNQSPDNRRCGTQPSTMQQNIFRASHLLRDRTQLQHGDYQAVIQTATVEDVVYMDPPYQGVCGRRNPRYSNSLGLDDFADALLLLNQKEISYIVSYDGRTGEKSFGVPLPDRLRLRHIEIKAGRSSQATLLGRDDQTYESLYFSPALMSRLEPKLFTIHSAKETMPSLFSSDYARSTATI
jgi:DNA adenine methylase